MAARSVKLNGLEEHISILQGDLRDAPARFGREQFDVVTANPPHEGRLRHPAWPGQQGP